MQHPVFEHPPANSTIWRYMDFSKFLAMLTSSSLFFSRLTTLDKNDPWEGHYPVMQFTPAYETEIAKELGWSTEQAKKTGDMLRNGVEAQRYKNAVSCWSIEEHENDALWRIYAPIYGIAIKSTFALLQDAITGHSPSGLYAGKVKYIDYSSAKISINNGFWPTIHKRLPFAYEKELRLVISEVIFPPKGIKMINPPNFTSLGFSYPSGHALSINLNLLIQEIIVNPRDPDWFVEMVQKTANKFNISCKVGKSLLLASPTMGKDS